MRLIDADALIVELMDSDLDHLQRDDWKEVIQIVADAPTIEQPKIIHCKDCKYYTVMTSETGICDLNIHHMGHEGFCSAAEEYTMEEFMHGQDMGNPEDGSL